MKMSVDQAAKELSADLSDDLGFALSNKAAKAVFMRVFKYVEGTLAEGNEINIPGFGKYRVVDKPEREVRNPATGEMMIAAAKRSLRFTPAKALKEAVAGK